ncbi:hypothetical protein M404DRAFT_998264 [Pisolithus tinctorius Marx 270]|uniref:Uncharacterized protein n=1 Tax=Pisolithus tinctorius Marx 270 TaxID=870435 RepID=A0A0C3PF41_PISTI|nr:hypothetical protein M404DRAFT_998264 [Pisolithus tinctorius Marx 270]
MTPCPLHPEYGMVLAYRLSRSKGRYQLCQVESDGITMCLQDENHMLRACCTWDGTEH